MGEGGIILVYLIVIKKLSKYIIGIGLVFLGYNSFCSVQTTTVNAKLDLLIIRINALIAEGQYDSARIHSQNGLAESLKLGYKRGVLAFNAGLAASYDYTGNYPSALKYYLEALKFANEMKDNKRVAALEVNIGAMYDIQGQYEKALSYYDSGGKIALKLKDYFAVSRAYMNIGIVYQNMKKMDTSVLFFRKAMPYCKLADNKEGIAMCNMNIGLSYQYLNNIDSMGHYYFIADKIFDEFGSYENRISSKINMASYYGLTGKYDQSIALYKEVELLSRKSGALANLPYAYQGMAEIYHRKKNYPLAYESMVRLKFISDTLFNEANSKALSDVKTKFEVEKREIELNAKSEAEKEKTRIRNEAASSRQKLIILSIIIVLLIVLLFSFFLFKRFQVTKHQKQIIEEQKAMVEEKQKEIVDSIFYAQRIQHALLASTTLLNKCLPEYFLFFQPKDIVSGDFYWATEANGKFYMVTADSTGHGVPGAFMSLLNISFLNEAITEKKISDPGEILSHVRRRLIQSLKTDGSDEGGKDGMDCILLCFDFIKNMLDYSAANNSFYIIRNKEIINCSADKMPVGKSPKDEEPFATRHHKIEKGDVIYTLTDGLPDQFGGPKGKKYKYKQLEDLLMVCSDLPMKEQKSILKSSFVNWKGNLEQVDDICIIGIRV